MISFQSCFYVYVVGIMNTREQYPWQTVETSLPWEWRRYAPHGQPKRYHGKGDVIAAVHSYGTAAASCDITVALETLSRQPADASP